MKTKEELAMEQWRQSLEQSSPKHEIKKRPVTEKMFENITGKVKDEFVKKISDLVGGPKELAERSELTYDRICEIIYGRGRAKNKREQKLIIRARRYFNEYKESIEAHQRRLASGASGQLSEERK